MKKALNEEQMLTDIAKIIMHFEPITAALLVDCKTLNEAIENILHSLT